MPYIPALNEELRRRMKTQTLLPSLETAPVLFQVLMVSGQIQMRKMAGWETLG